MCLMQDMNASRTAILDAAFAVYTEKPTATLADVARAAGVGRATLHRHFSGRQDLLVAMAEVALSELETAVDAAVAEAPSYTDALRLAVDAMIPLATRQLFLAKEPLDREPVLQATLLAQQAEMRAAIEGAKTEGTFAPEIPSDWIAQVFDSLIFAAWTSVSRGDATPRQAARLVWHSLIQGLKETPK